MAADEVAAATVEVPEDVDEMVEDMDVGERLFRVVLGWTATVKGNFHGSCVYIFIQYSNEMPACHSLGHR